MNTLYSYFLCLSVVLNICPSDNEEAQKRSFLLNAKKQILAAIKKPMVKYGLGGVACLTIGSYALWRATLCSTTEKESIEELQINTPHVIENKIEECKEEHSRKNSKSKMFEHQKKIAQYIVSNKAMILWIQDNYPKIILGTSVTLGCGIIVITLMRSL